MGSIFDGFFKKGQKNTEAAEIEYINERDKNLDKVKVSVKIYGAVQGVGFRFTTKQTADEIGVTGIVRNENDGSVYSEAVGSAEQINQFIEALSKGPSPAAQVDKVVVKFDKNIEEKSNFSQSN
ncbi:acylphosphatase [Marinilactibacillus piezotolerans]|uniref:acylphosphatase n=1 Tax=Marinilactibacillus piezotolerans TaxID=258723 RepID=A0A1I3WRN4_9LACT|nr:acylphosphatase [Marinilactibacillus piezotolerans]SFK09126.1 acylphosphatase [Marinilactibacillus piezotolerans]